MRDLHFGSLILSVLRFANLAVAAYSPELKLPWGTYEGRPFADDPTIYLFENVRFGSIPERFSAPQAPSWTNSSVQPPYLGRNCIPVDPKRLESPVGGEKPITDPGDATDKVGEDCLFLDLYVPKQVLARSSSDAPAPVVVWLYGGAFAYGSKNQLGPLYTGRAILSRSKYQTIFVAGNYRLGAFGWLAGDYMQKAAQPNAGLYDQALLFDWVQEHIGKVNGDKARISAFGESAGASSILHHVIREDGKKDPVFSKIAVQSPAFEWAWDNRGGGKLDKTYKTFSALAGCGETFDIDCLRKSTNLTVANQALFANVKQTGLFPVGPSVDGKWVKTIPTIAFSQGQKLIALGILSRRMRTNQRRRTGHYSKKVSSAIISHTWSEQYSFTPKYVNSEETFNAFLGLFLPGDDLAIQRQKIRTQYNCRDKDYKGNWNRCIGVVIRDASFTCNTRDLFSAYSGKSYMLRYAFPLKEAAVHASDLIALFANTKAEAKTLLLKSTDQINEFFAGIYADRLVNSGISEAYQTYLASFAISGDPNTLGHPGVFGVPSPTWPKADGSGDNATDVLSVQMPSGQAAFTLITDDQNTKPACAFWTNLAQEIILAQGKSTGGVGRDEL
ncbi:unnamed protein product [Clonostachys solani]|uniref:Carboxylesterase type B domain-containing protein n=1 Tax=Clonostachys solani TaxID=160281 RepID=A0A9P0EPE1_9HYPO|nr:unnamed protein product [Clonostachys solani]